MRVSFGPTSELGPVVQRKISQQVDHGEEDNNVGVTGSEHDLIRQLKKELEDAFKREEALRDRMTLQETINNKSVQELKGQLKKWQSEGTKHSKSRDGTPTIAPTRTERKRDGKSKDIREMQKTILTLREEKQVLEEKLQKMSDFVKIAGDMKTQANNECSYKDGIIQDLKGELRVVDGLYNQETRRRVQIEGELHSLSTYVDHIGQKLKEKMKNKSCQTETTVPPKFIIGNRATGSSVGFSSSNTSSYANLSATAAAWKLRNVEEEYQKETCKSRQKFHEAAQLKITGKRSAIQQQRSRSVSEYTYHQAPEADKSSRTLPAERKLCERPSTRSSHDSCQKRSVSDSAESSMVYFPITIRTRLEFT